MRPVQLIVPDGCLLNPTPGVAVAGGNVETSQRVVDVLLGALGVAAASQGTMNNFTFGSAHGQGRQYYETIAGGSGATATHDGASGVQVHMTNTRITDVEILEHRFPEVRVEQFALRKNSGGNGNRKGGDGVVRAIRFDQPREVSLLTQRRVLAPYAMNGGTSAKCGQNILVDSKGNQTTLPGKAFVKVEPGETIVIKTPGGGGWGAPKT
jgi:5-oxoprolinase (ATP-hydrolysing)